MSNLNQDPKLKIFDNLTDSKRVVRRVNRKVDFLISNADFNLINQDSIQDFHQKSKSLEENIDDLLSELPELDNTPMALLDILLETKNLQNKAAGFQEQTEDGGISDEWEKITFELSEVESNLLKPFNENIIDLVEKAKKSGNSIDSLSELEGDFKYLSKIEEAIESINKFEKLEAEFNSIEDKIDSFDKQFQRLTDDLERDREEFEEQIERLRSKEDEIENQIAELEEKQNQVERLSSELEALEDEASDLLRESVSGKLAEEFGKRKDELHDTLKYWKAASVVSIILLVGSSVWVYFDVSSTASSSAVALSKIALLLPVSVAVWFTVSNYNQQKRLMHEYEFKKNIIRSLPGFRERLEALLPDEDQEKVAEAVLYTMENVYSNPQQNIDNEQSSNQEVPLGNSQGSVSSLLQLLKR